jgi:Rrf2 family protein
MLSITTKSPYALSALVELHRQEASCPVPIAELARRREIPVQFLEQLFATLRRAGILRSQRGVKGGYSLGRPAEQITVLELVELLDGPLGGGASGIFTLAAQAAAAVLSDATVASVAEDEIRSTSAPMYYI